MQKNGTINMQVVAAKKYLSQEERKDLMQKNDWRAIAEILYQWAWVILAFALAYYFPHPLIYVLAIFVLGGKQLACAILTHDAGHHSLFKNKGLNEFVGNWLGAYPILLNMPKYRAYHLIHHQHNGLEEDPDLFLTRGYPTSRKSMLRKFSRDLLGITGIKYVIGIFLMEMGYLEYNLGGKVTKTKPEKRDFLSLIIRFFKAFYGIFISHLILFLSLYFLASGWLYLLWLGALLTTFQLIIRIRSIAEHSVIEDSSNPLLNTRTTYANFLEKIFFAPYNVNYHAEHHMLMSVPSYKLKKMHKIIKANGYYEDGGVLAKSYWEVIKKAASKAPKTS